jgi:RHS repeat-associated protein
VLGDLGYAYDIAGQRIAQTGSLASNLLPAASTGNAFDDNNRQTQYHGQTLSYDPSGNLITDGLRTYVWNAREQLIAIEQGGQTIAAFEYDALGRRKLRSEGGQAVQYLYDGLDPVQETRGTTIHGILTGLGIDERFARDEASGRGYFLTDALGSTRALTDGSGNLMQRYDYTPYGQTQAMTAGFDNPYQYTGRELDQSGLYYYRTRYYHPGMARFISEDPLRLAAGLNGYAYVGGNPMQAVDPLGLASCYYSIGDERLVCYPDTPGQDPLSIPVASGNNGAGLQCKNNPACTNMQNRGPIPTGDWVWTDGWTSKQNGRVLTPLPGTEDYGRDLFRSHSCGNPFGSSLGPKFCSEGCVTGTSEDIKRLNRIIDAEPGSTLRVMDNFSPRSPPPFW